MTSKVTKYSVEKYEKPTSGYIYREAFFIVKDNQFMVVRSHSLQCNSDQRIAEQVRDRLYPDAEVKKLGLYLPLDLTDLE